MTVQQSVVDIFKQIAGNQFGFFARLSSITDMLDSDFTTASCDEKFGKFVGRTNVREIGSRGVVDPDDGQLIGILKQSTILRCRPFHLNTLAEKDEDEAIVTAPLSTLVTRPVPNLPSTATPLDAIEVFLGQDCDCIFVYDDPQEILGVVTPFDVAKTIAVYNQIYRPAKPLQRLRLIDLDDMPLDEIFYRGAQTARDFMRQLPSVAADEPVLAVIKAMHDHHSTVIGLANENQDVHKVISLEDILIEQNPPTDLRNFGQTLNPAADEKKSSVGQLDLVPWAEVCESRDPVFQKPAAAVATTKTTDVEPTTRLSEILEILLEDKEEHVILVKSGSMLEGAVTIREVLRLFKTVLRIQRWESNERTLTAISSS